MQKNFSVKELLESTRKPSSAVKHNFELMTTDALLQITFIFDYHFKIRIKKWYPNMPNFTLLPTFKSGS